MTCGSAEPVSRTDRAAASASRRGLGEVRTSSAPAPARAQATAPPIPPDAPVTRARRRSSGRAFTLSPPSPRAAGVPPAAAVQSCGWARGLGAELAQEAPVVSADVLFDQPASVVELEQVHEVPDDPGPVRFEAASR